MAGLKTLVTLAFLASLGVMFLILACALPRYNNWWPLFVLIFYFFAPIPNMFARRMYPESDNGSNPGREVAWFITAGLVVSAFALPIVLARVLVIQWGACWLVLAGNVVTFVIIFWFILMTDNEDVAYTM